MIKHAFTCPVADDNDPDKTQPSDWNDPHVLEVVADDPPSPQPGEMWMKATGTTPDRLLEWKFCDTDGVVVTILTVVR